ncbi:MAG: hypothetical protein M5U12_35120 [Verrucomicrobia bacterium]|nr:hypothetical protein [Verrucomicrobiota bacterium]
MDRPFSSSVDSLAAIHPAVIPHHSAILASLGTADADRVVAPFDELVIALLQPLAPVITAILAVLHPRGSFLRADERGAGHGSSQSWQQVQELAAGGSG